MTPVAPPPALGAIERSSDRTSMKSETSFTTSMSCMAAKRKKREVHRLLEMRLAVFQARLLYPTDDVLEQLENTLEKRQFLGRKAMHTSSRRRMAACS